jgi:hypothetical protein
MRNHLQLPLFPLSTVALVLAVAPAARAVNWLPLANQICNDSSQPANLKIEFRTDWRLGYQTVPGAAAGGQPLDVPEVLHIPANTTISLFVAEPGAQHQAQPVSFLLLERDESHRGGGNLYPRCTLDIHPTGVSALFRDHTYDNRREQQYCLCAPGRLIILDSGTDAHSSLESKSGQLPPGPPPIPDLGDEDMEAAVKQSYQYYTTDRLGGMAYQAQRLNPGFGEELHAHGHLLPEQVLADIFCNTVFQYNTAKIMGVLPRVNYGQYPTMERYDKNYRKWLEDYCRPCGIQVLAPPHEGGDFTAFRAYKEAVETAIDALRANKTLLLLGIAYQRQKIVSEKLGWAWKAALAKNDLAGKKRVQEIQSAQSKFTNQLQTMAFELMRAGYTEFVHQYLATPPAHRRDVGNLLVNYLPPFANTPYYKQILDHILDYTRPTDRVDGFSLEPPPQGPRPVQ